RCGEADTTLLFIHGWNINKEYWQAQIDHFCPRYQVVAIDLPGFGKSGRNRSNWAIEVYGRDILQIIRTLELKNVVLIGHSMSGDVMLEAARQDPSAMIGLIGVDNFKEVGKAYSQEELLTVDTFFQ
ncbi:MAG: alpha/beta hydrolase, partial [Saprospiraceae bacterium]|nr:alpha/beta hydrolase [Saprospiraceae bacterium]